MKSFVLLSMAILLRSSVNVKGVLPDQPEFPQTGLGPEAPDLKPRYEKQNQLQHLSTTDSSYYYVDVDEFGNELGPVAMKAAGTMIAQPEQSPIALSSEAADPKLKAEGETQSNAQQDVTSTTEPEYEYEDEIENVLGPASTKSQGHPELPQFSQHSVAPTPKVKPGAEIENEVNVDLLDLNGDAEAERLKRTGNSPILEDKSALVWFPPQTSEFCNPKVVFGLQSCDEPSFSKHGPDWFSVGVFIPGPKDKFGLGLHLVVKVKTGGTGIRKIGFQAIGVGDRKFPMPYLGRFVPFDSELTEPRCKGLSLKQPDTSIGSKFVHTCGVPVSGATTPPTAITMDFGPNAIMDYAIRWRYDPAGPGLYWTGAQFQLFAVPATDDCVIKKVLTVSLMSITLQSTLPPPNEYDCQSIPLSMDEDAQPASLDPESAASLKEFKKYFCMDKSEHEKKTSCSSETGPEVRVTMELYRPQPPVDGWIFVEIENMIKPAFPGPWFLQAVSKLGNVIGSWMSTEDTDCSDLDYAADIFCPDSQNLQYITTPKGQTGAVRHVLQLLVPPKEVLGAPPRTMLIFRYAESEAKDIAAGFQIQVSTVYRYPIPPDADNTDCVLQQHSAVYTADSSGTKNMQIGWPEKCMGTKLSQKAPPGPLPLYLSPHESTACKRFSRTLETNIENIPSNPNSKSPEISKVNTAPSPDDDEFIDSAPNVPVSSIASNPQTKMSTAEKAKDFDMEEFYGECGELQKGCVVEDRECMDKHDCSSVVTYKRKEDRSEIEIYASTHKYVAIGLSRDQLMGNDSVIECVREEAGIRIYRSYNDGQRNRRMKDHSALGFLKGSYTNGWLYCQFHLMRKTTAHRIIFDLAEESFYILTARGDQAADGIYGFIGYHGTWAKASAYKHKLMDTFGETESYKVLKYIHAACIIVAWVLLVPISTFAVRYFKETYANKYFCGLNIWFAIHVFLMGTVVALNIGAVVSAYFLAGGFGNTAKGWYFHNIGGILLLSLMVVQVMLGVGILRNNRYRLIVLNKFHGLIGHSQFFLAIGIIYFSKDMRGGVSCHAPYVLITWLCFYFIVHLCMSYQVCYIDFVQGEPVSRVYGFPALPPARITTEQPEAPGATIRKSFFGAIIFSGMVATALLVHGLVTGHDCIENALHHDH